MDEQNIQNERFYAPDGSNNMNVQPEKKNKALKALKLIGIIFGVIALLFIVLVIISIATDDADYNSDESISQNEVLSEEHKKSILGTYTDNSYINEFAQLKFNLPNSSWVFKLGDDLYEVYQDSAEKDENGKTYIQQNKSLYYYDMFAIDNAVGTRIELAITQSDEKISGLTTEDIFLNNSKAAVSEADAGEIYDIVIAGENYRAIDLYYNDIDLGYHQLMAVRKIDKEFVIIIASGYSDVDSTSLSEYMQCFEKIQPE